MANYGKMTQEEFDTILAEILDEQPASHLLSVPGVYEVVAEHFNNDVLDKWADGHPDDDVPDGDDDPEGRAWQMRQETVDEDQNEPPQED